MEIIPFKNVDGIMLVSGRADGVEGLFAFDTGAMQTALNRKYFPDFVGKDASVAIFDENMSEAAAAEVVLREFSVGNIAVLGLNALLIDMNYVENALRTTMPDLRFYGSIGAEVFGSSPILLDYEHSEITVEPDADVTGSEKITLIPGALPVITIDIAGEVHKFVLDTGANTCLLSADLAEKIDVSPSEDLPGAYIIPKIRVGTHEYHDIAAVFTDISHIRAKVDADGVIGSQILSEQPAILDIANCALYLLSHPNPK